MGDSNDWSYMNAYDYMRIDRGYFEDFVSRSTYNSNAIEGNTLTLAETYAIQWCDDSMEIKATARELYEAINYKYALSAAMEDETEGLSEVLVKRIACNINRNINELDDYRRVQVMIRGAEHVPPAPEQVRSQMMQLVWAYNQDVADQIDPFVREATFHIRFERIHPFEDGNGRTGRILLDRGLLLSGEAPAVISREVRADYLQTISEVDIDSLAAILRDSSARETERMEAFRAARGVMRP